MSSMVTLEMQISPVFWRLYTLKCKNFIMEHDILSVSKSVALYQKYVHIKNGLAMGYITRVGRQVKMIFIPVPEANYTQVRHTDLLVFCLSCSKNTKICGQEYKERVNGICPVYLYQSAYKTGKYTESAMHHVITHIQEEAEKREITLEFS